MLPTDIQKLRSLTSFEALVAYLADELDWPIDADQVDKLAFEYKPEELGIDPQHAVKIESVRQVRPLADHQPWGIFYIKFESKQLPVVVLRRILHSLVRTSRQKSPDRPTWKINDLLFISSQGEASQRSVSFAHFHQTPNGNDELRTFSWDVRETHLYYIKNLNLHALRWPKDEADIEAWRKQWSSAFLVKHGEVPRTAEMLSKEMARIARDIREAVGEIYSIEHSGGPLHQLHLSLKMDLINDLSEADFADMYAQTVTYGLFAARATHTGSFNVADASALIAHTNPFLRELLEQMMNQQALDLSELGVSELTDLLGKVNIESILRDFGRQKRGEDPVIHFYETFMRAYDAKQKTRRGEFYTPDPVVSFIVRSVDYLLRTEFGCPDGFASTAGEGGFQPVVLDPATGTGTFLKYIIEVIWETFYHKNKNMSAAERQVKWNKFVRENVLPRLYAFELKMSPYTIAHMKVGLALQEKGFEFQEGERLRIYLTNALQPAHEVARVDTPALAHEAEKANEVKNKVRVSVVIGNPPYAYESQNTGNWISQLIKDYYKLDGESLNEHNPRGLQDDYVKFIRLAQYFLTKNSEGILAFVTNHSYIDNPTFRGMRRELIKSFNEIYICDLHGSLLKKEKSPDGSKDENVFDIQPGVSIMFLVKHRDNGGEAKVYHSEIYGSRIHKYQNLLLRNASDTKWTKVLPTYPFYMLKPQDVDLENEYNQGEKITSIFDIFSSGLFTSRDELIIHWSKEEIWNTVKDFVKLEPEVARRKYQLGEDVRDWKVDLAQKDLKASGMNKMKVVSILYRPFDERFTYYTGRSRGFMCMPRREVMEHMLMPNLALITSRMTKGENFQHVHISQNIVEKICMSSKTSNNGFVFPLYQYSIGLEKSQQYNLPIGIDNRRSNFKETFITDTSRQFGLTFSSVGMGDLIKTIGPEDIFHYIYAILHSINYRYRYNEFLRIDFPRLPLTNNLELFRKLCGLGKELVALHLVEAPVLNHPITSFTGQGDAAVAKGYPKYQDGVVLVNPAQGFEGVPEDVWNFHIGGYQVCEKWLKDRRGRQLSAEDIAHYQKIVVALKETIRLMREIDEVIDQHGGWPIQ